MATKNQIRAQLRKKERAGLLPPQECPKCKADLSDPDVPEEYLQFRRMFGVSREIRLDDLTAAWMCPVCDHVWGKHLIPDDLKPRV